MGLQVKVICENMYDSIGPRNYNLIRVRKSGKYGFLDFDGNEVIKRKYNQTHSYNRDHYIRVYVQDKQTGNTLEGAIDTDGNEIIPLYSLVDYYGEGLFGIVQEGKHALYDINKQCFVTPFDYELLNPFLKEGRIAAKKDGKWGYIDGNGNVAIDFLYDDAQDFKDGLGQVRLGSIWKNIDRTGRMIVEPNLEGPKAWEKIQISYHDLEGGGVLAPQLKGLVDSNTGKIILEPDAKYDKFDMHQMHSFGVGLFTVGKKYGLVDYKGNILIQPKYDSLKFPIYEKDGKYGLLNSRGEEITGPIYDEIDPFGEGLAGARKGEWCGFIDATGKIAIEFTYDYVGSFFKGLAPVGLRAKYGVIDKTGKLVVDMLHDGVKYLDNDKRLVETEDQYRVLDLKTGAISPPFDEVLKESIAVPVRKGEKWYLADPQTWELISEPYARIDWVSDRGIFQFKANAADKRWGILRAVRD